MWDETDNNHRRHIPLRANQGTTLERHGYLFRQVSAQDARSSHSGLTEKGWAIKSDFEEVSLLLEQKIYGDIPLVDRERITKLLVQIEGNLAS